LRNEDGKTAILDFTMEFEDVDGNIDGEKPYHQEHCERARFWKVSGPSKDAIEI